MFRVLVVLLSLSVAACSDRQTGAMDQGAIRIAGSSTLAPFAMTVAEQFGLTTQFRTPIVETTGTGGGLKMFCSESGPRSVSIATASRAMKATEIDLCLENEINKVIELTIGFDGVVVIKAAAARRLDFTKLDLYRALAEQLPAGDALVQNPHTNWSQVSPQLPDLDIKVFGPPPTSGTRDAFIALALVEGAQTALSSEPLIDDMRVNTLLAAKRLRADGVWIDSGENDSGVLRKLVRDPTALGVVSYAISKQHRGEVIAASIDGVVPTQETITSGAYPLSRPLYLYVKADNVGAIAGLDELITLFMSNSITGEGGVLHDRGLIPLPPEQRTSTGRRELDLSQMGTGR